MNIVPLGCFHNMKKWFALTYLWFGSLKHCMCTFNLCKQGFTRESHCWTESPVWKSPVPQKMTPDRFGCQRVKFRTRHQHMDVCSKAMHCPTRSFCSVSFNHFLMHDISKDMTWKNAWALQHSALCVPFESVTKAEQVHDQWVQTRQDGLVVSM